jgi:hypothetical protein
MVLSDEALHAIVVEAGSRMKIREHLSASGLFRVVRSGFEKIVDTRAAELVEISLADTLMSAFAMFSLKDPSLLAFDKRRQTDDNLHTVYGIEQVPCDTQMRTTLDQVEPGEIKTLYTDVFRELQRGKELEKFVFMEGCYLLSLDGTGYFASHKIHCAACLKKVNKKTGEVTYYHQMLGGAIVHPDLKEVIPLAPEPIIKQDGQTKNDCERNAAKRFFEQLRRDHPHLPLIITEDALSSNAPHIEELIKHDLHYILGVKEGDHAYLFEQVQAAHQRQQTTEVEIKGSGVTHQFRFINQIGLNQSNPDLRVNFVEYWEVSKNGKIQHFSWITDFRVTRANVFQIMRGGRARWKIENETFNTLKNQGYHFEHNFGHGEKNLSVVFALLMMLAFLVDQTQQVACRLFQAVLSKIGCRTRMWEDIRSLFHTLPFDSMESIYRALLHGFKIEGLVILDSG